MGSLLGGGPNKQQAGTDNAIFNQLMGTDANALTNFINNPSSGPGTSGEMTAGQGLLNFPSVMGPEIAAAGNTMAANNTSAAKTLARDSGGAANPNALAESLNTQAVQSNRQGTQALGATLGSQGLQALGAAGSTFGNVTEQFLQAMGIGTGAANAAAGQQAQQTNAAAQTQSSNANGIGQLLGLIFGF